MWEDGTYEEMFAKVSKEYPAVHERIKFKAPVDRRRKIFNLQAMTGAEVFGDAMLRKTLQDSFAEDRIAELRNTVKKVLPTATEQQLEEATQQLRIARRQQEIARRLKLDERNPLVMAAAAAELKSEKESKREAEAIAGNLAEQAEERHEVDVARLREGRRARAARGLLGLVRARTETSAVRTEASAPVSAAAARREERRGGAGGPPPAEITIPTSPPREKLTAADILKESSSGRRGKGRPAGGALSPEESEAAKQQRLREAREAAVGKRAAKSGELSAALRAAGLDPESLFSSSSSSRR